MSRNFYIGDIVLLKTDLMTWNHWPMGKVIETNSDDKGVVRSVKLLLKNYHPRQIGKNLFLVKNETSCCDNAQIQGCAAGHYQIKKDQQNCAACRYEPVAKSESPISKMYQQSCFQNEISRLLDEGCVSRKSNIFKLDPFLDDHEIIRVGGRIRQSRMEYKLKHSILLPKNGHIT